MGLLNLLFRTGNVKSLDSNSWRDQFNNDKNGIILDVRTPSEFKSGIIPGAIHMDVMDPQGFESKLKTLDKSKNYYVYCRSGARSKRACSILQKNRFENTFNLKGGINSYSSKIVRP